MSSMWSMSGSFRLTQPLMKRDQCITTRPFRFSDFSVDQFRKRADRNPDFQGDLLLCHTCRLDVRNQLFPIHLIAFHFD